MQKWANKKFLLGSRASGSAVSLPKGKPGGKGTGKALYKGNVGNYDPSKRQRRSQAPRTECQAVKELAVNTASLGLQTAKKKRINSGRGSVTALCKDNALAEAVMEVDDDITNPKRTMTQKWAALNTALVSQEQIPADIKKVINQHMVKTESEGDLYLLIDECFC